MIGSSENRVSYNGNDVTTEFPFAFKILEATDLKLLLVEADGTEKPLTSDYFVDMNKSVVFYPGYSPGTEPPASEQPPKLTSGQRLVIYREVPITQESALDEHWPFNVIEAMADKLTIICQQLWGGVKRSLKISVADFKEFDPTVPIAAGKSFRVSDDGKKLEVTEDPAKVMPIVEGLLEETKEVKAEAIEETTAIKNSAVTETTNIKNQMVKEAEEIKDAAVKETTQIADAALSSARLASQKANEAKTSANSALGSKNEASNSAELAEKWAQGNESPDGSAGSKSSKSWAMEAGQRATAANLSANSASQSANAAQGSEETASSKAAAASNSANAAKQSELKAKQYKDEAFAGTPEGYAELVERVNNMGHFSVVNGALCINYEKEDDIL